MGTIDYSYTTPYQPYLAYVFGSMFPPKTPPALQGPQGPTRLRRCRGRPA